MITKVSHMTLFVSDQGRAYDVYVHKLGFKVCYDFTMDNGQRWLTVAPQGQSEMQITLLEAREPVVDKELVPHYRALMEANALGAGVFQCDDCRKTYEELSAKGIEFLKKPTKEFYGIEAVFRDGCGNWFSLTEPQKEE